MVRKQKIALLNGILKGEKPMACIFSEWPEKTYYAGNTDEDNFTTADGKIISLEEVDYELMNYPKVRVIYKETKEEVVKISYLHKYIDENGQEVEKQDGVEAGALCSVRKPTESQIQDSGLCATGQGRDEISDLTIPNKSGLSNLNAEKPSELAPDPKPPPEPFLSRKDREVMAQGSLYCVR